MISERIHIAKQFKETRRVLEISLAELSQRTGIDPAALSRLENGKQTNPTLETLARVARALGRQLVCDLRET
jgi:transcriptional regulator with XRE-family HTH domain